MTARLGVIVMTLALALYIVLVSQRVVIMIGSGEPVAVAMGVALIILPLVAAWGLVREVRFGVRAEELARRLEKEGGLPTEEIDTRQSGRPMRDAADELFPAYRADVDAHPEDWKAWFRLSMVYDGAGDRTRARQAVRRAIALERAGSRGSRSQG